MKEELARPTVFGSTATCRLAEDTAMLKFTRLPMGLLALTIAGPVMA